ncbi:Polyketide synthase PksM [Mycena venus]|uniref:Polyketide synthase PksM n=1 Tax=Mycena venus TaxID=2733690 RepID=A0A8H7D0T1_9AGAR|nr:Polyketide synthase PksM [Mycena venus]
MTSENVEVTSENELIDPALDALDLNRPHPSTHHYKWDDDMSDLTDLDESDGELTLSPTDALPSTTDYREKDEREEGEISDDTELKDKTDTERKSLNRKRHQRGRSARTLKEAKQLKAAQDVQKQVLAAVYGCSPEKVHIYNVRRDAMALSMLQDQEEENKGALTRANVDKICPDFQWIHESGIHLGFLFERGGEGLVLVFAVRIRAWDGMESNARIEIQETLQIVMDCGDNAYPINNNAAAKFSPATPAPPPAHGVRGSRGIAMEPPCGVMYGLGWHLSQELGKSLVNYAPNRKDPESLAIYMAQNAKLPRVAALYRQGLSTLFPAGANTLQAVADRDGVLSFADKLDGVSAERPFANSLTATKCGFCNRQHCDKDHAPAAYGLWWEAICNAKGKECKFDQNAEHNKTKGGEFVWGAFKVGVDFERAQGLVEIFWRGQFDFHGTLSSTDDDGFTRFGTSIQITAKGVNAMHKVWNVAELAQSGHNVHNLTRKSRVTTPQNRFDRGMAEQSTSKKRKTRNK